jgi:hypothetical protein
MDEDFALTAAMQSGDVRSRRRSKREAGFGQAFSFHRSAVGDAALIRRDAISEHNSSHLAPRAPSAGAFLLPAAGSASPGGTAQAMPEVLHVLETAS